MAKICYVRVSTLDQNEGRQFALFEERGIKLDKIYMEKVSGKDIYNRPQLQAMLEYVREGDIVYIESISRLARNIMDLLNIVKQLQVKKVELVSIVRGNDFMPLQLEQVMDYIIPHQIVRTS